jgi:hypothetical protein
MGISHEVKTPYLCIIEKQTKSNFISFHIQGLNQ